MPWLKSEIISRTQGFKSSSGRYNSSISEYVIDFPENHPKFASVFQLQIHKSSKLSILQSAGLTNQIQAQGYEAKSETSI